MNCAILKPASAAAMITLLGMTGAHAAGNTGAGAQVFQSQCAMCHSATPGAHRYWAQPGGCLRQTLAGVQGYDYSPALKSAHLVWNDATLDKFLAAPQKTPFPARKCLSQDCRMPGSGRT